MTFSTTHSLCLRVLMITNVSYSWQMFLYYVGNSFLNLIYQVLNLVSMIYYVQPKITL